MASGRLDGTFEIRDTAPLLAPLPLSFAQMAQRSRPPPGFEPIKQKEVKSSASTIGNNLPRLKRWPKSKDPKVLSSYLELELKNKERLNLFLQISGENKTEKILIIMRGLPGSGKSQLATLLAGVTDKGIILSADDYFLNSNGIYAFNPDNIGKAHEACQTKCNKAMMTSQNPIIIDNTNTMIWEMIPYVKMALKYNYQVHLAEPLTEWKTNVRILTQKNVHGVCFKKIKAMQDRYDKNVTADLMIQIASKDGDKKEENALVAALDSLNLK